MLQNLIDIFIFLDFLLLMIGLFKYLLSFFPLLTSLCFTVTVIFDNFVYTNNFNSGFTNSFTKEIILKSQGKSCPS